MLDDSRASCHGLHAAKLQKELTAWLSISWPCNARELKGVLNFEMLCRVHAASLQRELVHCEADDVMVGPLQERGGHDH